ncbi:transferrin binding protein [Volucribacter psittacicida]|uniref:Transferrin binding protein n=1 Tax=Volucribacter psittacicida TaxID=203482 RepID=A0A4R1FUN5_9PAST|nr:Slam-dependent surface lipoprotein [Volucribacter psittacicida]TCJ98020.1 transferrin binding protein [Volucribacter psittacicida]
MNKAQYLKFGLTLATAVVLAACGSSGGGDNSESPSANTGSGSTPPASTPSTSGTSSGGNAGTGSNQTSSSTAQSSTSGETSNSGYVSVKSDNSAVSNVQEFNANSLTSITVNGTNIQLSSYPGIYSGGWLSLNGNNNCCGKFESVKVGSYNVSSAETYLYYTGVLTPENQMPTSGKSIYNGDSVYTVRNRDSLGSNVTETGSAQLTADFATKKLSGTLTHGATTISLDAQIAQNTFQGTAISSGEPGQGSVQGNFYGPNAKELGGIAKGDNWAAGFAASK